MSKQLEAAMKARRTHGSNAAQSRPALHKPVSLPGSPECQRDFSPRFSVGHGLVEPFKLLFIVKFPPFGKDAQKANALVLASGLPPD